MNETEKKGLIEDLRVIGEMLTIHDNSIFQLLASVNVLKSILIEAGITSEEKILTHVNVELKKIQTEVEKYLSQEDPK